MTATGARATDQPRLPHPIAGGRLPAGQLLVLLRAIRAARSTRPVVGVHGITPVLDAARRRAGATR